VIEERITRVHLRPTDVSVASIVTKLEDLRVRESNLAQLMHDIRAERKALQAKCPHYCTRYNEDPAGGSDHYDYCDICGAAVE
jgi:hypothetical protein